MTGAEHAAEAERLLGATRFPTELSPEVVHAALAAAQIHATLAVLDAVTALRSEVPA